MGFLELVGAIVVGMFAYKLIDIGLGILWGWLFD